MRKDLTWSDGREPTDSVGKTILWPKSMVCMHYHVVMGRRSQLNLDLMLRKARLVESDGYQLITYDRVLEMLEGQRRRPGFQQTAKPPRTPLRRS